MYSEGDWIESAGLLAAVEQAADAIVIADTAGIIRYVNPAFTALTGYTSREAVGQNPRILKSGTQPASVYRGLWETIRSGRVWQGEIVNRRKDGTLYHEEMRVSPVCNGGAETTAYIAIKRDITSRRAEIQAQALLAAIVESSGAAIIACAPSGVILSWNRGAEAIFGYTAAEAVGRHCSQFVPPDRIAHLLLVTEMLAQGGFSPPYDSFGLHKDGRRIPVSVTGWPVRNSAGELAAVSLTVRDISERQQAEQNRALLASIVESSDDAIIAGHLDGTILSWNRGAELLFGYSSSEIIGENADILAPPDRRDVARVLGAIGEGHAVEPFETVRCRKDGSAVEVSVRVSPIRNPAGQVVGYSANCRDISQRIRVEQELRESGELLREVFEHAPFGMSVSTLDGRFIQANATLCRMLGYSEEELRSTTWHALTHPDDVIASVKRREQLLRNPTLWLEAEKRYIHRGGNVVRAHIRISLVRDGAGHPLYSVLHVEDITERQRAKDALRESEDRFRIMADGCPTAMWVTGVEGEMQFINHAFREFLGIAPEEPGERPAYPPLHPDDTAAYVSTFLRAVKEHSSFRAEARARRFDGVWRWFASHAEPRLSPDGEYLGHVGMSLDITERKQAEQTLRDSREFAQSTIDALPSHVCVLDQEGSILAVNQAWRRFAEENRILAPGEPPARSPHPEHFAEGAGYLAVCDRAAGPDAAEAAAFAAGIRAVLHGERQQFSMEYPCHAPGWSVGSSAASRASPAIAGGGCSSSTSTLRNADNLSRPCRPVSRSSANWPRTSAKSFGLCRRRAANCYTSARPTNRYGAEPAKVSTLTPCRGRRPSIPMTGSSPALCLPGKSREKPSIRNTASIPPAASGNGSATGPFPFAARMAGWFAWSALPKRLPSANAMKKS